MYEVETLTKKEENPGYVTRAECRRTTKAMKEDILIIRNALVGKDLRGGLVADVAELKKERSTTVEVVKSIVLPILLAVITAAIISAM